MQNEEAKQNPWLFFANNDLALAEVAIDNLQFTGQVAFLCQQAIEKYLICGISLSYRCCFFREWTFAHKRRCSKLSRFC